MTALSDTVALQVDLGAEIDALEDVLNSKASSANVSTLAATVESMLVLLESGASDAQLESGNVTLGMITSKLRFDGGLQPHWLRDRDVSDVGATIVEALR